MANPVRTKKIADAVKREVVQMLQRDLNDPRLQDVTVSDVEMTRDLGTATVFFTIQDETKAKEAATVLNKATGFVRRGLAQSSVLKYTPKIKFKYDNSILRAERIDQLLQDD